MAGAHRSVSGDGSQGLMDGTCMNGSIGAILHGYIVIMASHGGGGSGPVQQLPIGLGHAVSETLHNSGQRARATLEPPGISRPSFRTRMRSVA